MKVISLIHFVLLFALLFASCSSDDDTSIHTPVEPDNVVRFNIGFAPYTRAITDAQFNTVFQDGDEIGVFALKQGTTEVVAQNVKLVLTNGNWIAATDADKIYYSPSIKTLDFYAYYPYQGDHNTTMSNLPFEVKADQSTTDNYSKSDLLTATAVSQSNSLVNLYFTHLMAMIQVTAGRVAPVPAFRDGTDADMSWSTTLVNKTIWKRAYEPYASSYYQLSYDKHTGWNRWLKMNKMEISTNPDAGHEH